MKFSQVVRLGAGDREWPVKMSRLRGLAPTRQLDGYGPMGLLQRTLVAVLCSSCAPGNVILPAHDIARRLRDTGQTVISGFQSDIEKQCLEILIRGTQPIIICPARSIHNMRIPRAHRAAFDAGRILYLSPFDQKPRRVTKSSAARRNEIVAALADSIYIPYAAPRSQTERIAKLAKQWGIPCLN